MLSLVSALAGAVVGALIAHYAARARSAEDYERVLESLVYQDERRIAQTALAAVHELRNQINAGTFDSKAHLHNAWVDRVATPCAQIRDDDLSGRIKSSSAAMFFATMSETYANYIMLRAVLDVEDFLSAWLRRDEPPAPHLPPMATVWKLVVTTGGKFDLDPLTDALALRGPG